MASSGEQQLLYALRSPTTPLSDKLALAASSLSSWQRATPAHSTLPQVIRDWLLDTLYKLVRSSSTATEQALVDARMWELLRSTTRATLTSSTSTPVLPVYVAFLRAFTNTGADDGRLVSDATAVWQKLAANAMRKATVDAVLDGYDKLVKTTLSLFERGAEENRGEWEELAVVWLKAIKPVLVEAAKGGKKVPSHTLTLLPTLVPLLDRLSPTSCLRSSLLETVQLSLFNLDNLRRGLARESYASGGSSANEPAASSSSTTADSELLASLSSFPAELHTSLYTALPALTRAYLASLSSNSSTLFPLPAKATFPTPSAQKSALEVLGLSKRRDLAGRWVRGVVELTAWTTANSSEELGTGKARGLARVLEEVERGDLYRPGQAGDAWQGVLPSITKGAVERLEGTDVADGSKRDATIEVLSSIHRLEYDVLDHELPRILAVLARTPSSLDHSAATSTFLSLLLTHHSRSLTVPTLLSCLSDALASSPYTAPNNLLTTFHFTAQLGRSISGMLSSSSSIRSTWENLLTPVTAILSPPLGATDSMSIDQDETVASNASPTKKRKLSSLQDSDPSRLLSAAARTRILASFIAHLPTPSLASLVDAFAAFSDEIVDSNLEAFAELAVTSPPNVHLDEESPATPSKKAKKSKRKSVGGGKGGGQAGGGEKESLEPTVVLGIELLEARYAILSRMHVEGLISSQGWVLMNENRRKELRRVVEKGSREAVIASTRVLLQQLELAESTLEDTSSILTAVLSRLNISTSSPWSGCLRDLDPEQVSLALWELVSRRWMVLLESLANEDQLKQLVAIIVESLKGGPNASRDEITRRLLKRADFWELSSCQAQFRPALLDLVSLPALTSPGTLLPLLSGSTPADSLSSARTISTATLLSTSQTFSRLAAFVPFEYLGRALRSQLAERALSLDLWISIGEPDLAMAEREVAQSELRRFVAYMGPVVDQAPQVLAALVRHTLPGAKSATLALYRALIQTSLSTFSDSKSPAELLSFLGAFGDKPLADVAKRAKKDAQLSRGFTCEESAYVLLLELLATSLGDVASLPSALVDAIRSSVKTASKPFGKAVTAVSAAPITMDAFQLGDLLEATRAIWSTKDWLNGAAAVSDEQDVLYAELTQSALASMISRLPDSVLKPTAFATCLSLLELLSYRVRRLRASGTEENLRTQPFEVLIASQLLFRQSFGVAASTIFDSNLVRATAAATLREYAVSLEGVSAAVASAVAKPDLSNLSMLRANLSMAMILLRDGPEGSVKSSSAAFSELLRHLSLLVEVVSVQSEQDQDSAEAYLLVATFLDGVCADRPMLLSRLNVSGVLSLVSRILQPSPASGATVASPTASDLASSLLRTFASTVGHLVRHRKDHIVPLFPQLVSTLSAFLSTLRRAGFGSTGSSVSLQESDTGVVLGQRAEREARATFPAWVWQGGAKGINRGEAAAVARLLGSLTTKTTAIQHKNPKNQAHGSAEGGSSSNGGTTTTSLAAPLSKHAPFLLLAYLRACVHPTCPIPSALRGELQGGWFEVMDSMGKWEREALMKGFLSEDEEAERGVLRELWKSWEKERYRG